MTQKNIPGLAKHTEKSLRDSLRSVRDISFYGSKTRYDAEITSENKLKRQGEKLYPISCFRECYSFCYFQNEL